MNKNLKLFLMLFLLLIFSMSCVHAANQTDDSTSDVATISADNTEINNILSKKDSAENIKTAEATTKVSSYDSLKSELTTKANNKTIDITKNTYKITSPISINGGAFDNLVINGNGATIDGSNSKSFLTINSNNKVTINDLTIKNTKGTSQSGALVISNKATVILNNCNFINDVSTGKGGAITNRGTTTINDCTFKSNTGAQGGAIWSTGEYGGSLTIEKSTFTNNKASNTNNYDKTAVIYVVSGNNINILSNTFENNNGRAIHSFKANMLISSNTFKNTILNAPKATIRGAVIDNYEANFKIIGNVFNNITVSAQSVKGGLLYNEIGKSAFDENKITNFKVTSTAKSDSLNGGILFNRNSTLNVTDNTITNTNNGYKVHGGALYNNIGTLNVYRNTFNTKNTAANEISGGAIYNDKTGNTKSKLYYSENDFSNLKNSGTVRSKTIYNLGIMEVKAAPIVKKATVVTVNQVNGVVGDSITFVANVKDINSNAVTGGNVVFKLNGKSLRTDGSLEGSSAVKKISVSNGVAKFTVTASLAIRGAKTISASYSGSTKYLANSTKGKTTAEITLRKAALTVTASPKTQKQYETIKFTVNVKDVTKNTKTTTPLNSDDAYVFFKINGKTLTDSKNNPIKAKITNGVATYNYVVPAGMSAIGKDKSIRYYNVTAGFVNPNYYPNTKNITQFNVKKCEVNITTTSIVANMTSRKIQIKGDIKDIKNNNLIGTNRLNLKINGKSVLINNQSFVELTNGKISINADIPENIENIKSITLVTGARTAYEGCRTTFTSITKV